MSFIKSSQRVDVLRHHLNFVQQQFQINNFEYRRQQLKNTNSTDRNRLTKRKVLKNSNPAKIRNLTFEKVELNGQQIDDIREYSHCLCRKKLDKLDNEFNKTLNNNLIPSTNIKNYN